MSETPSDESRTGAEIVLQAKPLVPCPHDAKALAAIAAIPSIGGPLATYLGARAGEVVAERIEQLAEELTSRIRKLEAQDTLDRKWLDTEEGVEVFDEVTNKVAVERDAAKRELYAAILINTARMNVDRSFYPTALKLLDALAPIHIEILRELLNDEKKRKGGRGEQNTSTRELAIGLHLEALEELRVAGLSDEIPYIFSEKLEGVRAWDEALGAADNVRGQVAQALKDKFRGWDNEILRHIWYIGKERLVHQETERRSSINELGVELLEWLAEPED